MAKHTSFRIGGPADVYVVCETTADVAETLTVLTEEHIPYTALGKGSNLLVSDEGYRGAVVVLGKQFKKHLRDGNRLEAGAACILAYVVQDALAQSLGGMEFAVGIPGTVGGALAMNAGSREQWIGAVTESVTLFVPGDGLIRLRGDEIRWAYRTSGLRERGVILESVLHLSPAAPARIRAEMEASLSRRRQTQPIGVASAGSVFVNPEGDSAGRLIESAGLKGMRLGGACVSNVHANFIVNDGGATAADVLGLVGKIQMTVKDTYGIDLKPEIRFLGELG
ncbi:MAG: UDP-N-acetylmuramate dehydrogenase [Coriobacteriia bacterium]|nr:UDP-N-acetylmuramate dehydrogenase [Coriobacteriia bacterium]MBN2822594.1 UDP-N-acetylmuramate dehydrogenase [Coriobacteriia bacterium]